jgi:nucleoside-diphosphate-sugar epimerase
VTPNIRFSLVANQFVFRGLTYRRLTVYGGSSNRRPLIYITDAARAYADSALNRMHDPQQVYNIGTTGENHRIAEIACVSY